MNEDDLEIRLAAWFASVDEPAAPRRLREKVVGIPDLSDRHGSRWWRARPTVADLTFVLAAAVVLAMALVVVGRWPVVEGVVGGPPASASDDAGPTSPSLLPGASAALDPARVIGLPPAGTMPRTREASDLVLRFEGTGSGLSMWVYADGRVIWSRFHQVPDEAREAYIGLSEQRLTSRGVEFLRSAVIATGMFDRDLVLAREGHAPFLQIQVLNGDRLVEVTWAWRGIAGDAPTATSTQQNALTGLIPLFGHSDAWPEWVWADATIKDFIPSGYLVCFGVKPDRSKEAPNPETALGERPGPNEPGGIWTMLPEPARRLLRLDDRTQDSMRGDLGCARVTTEDARSLVRIFDDAGIRRDRPEPGSFWIRYTFEEPGVPGNEVWIQFGPILPNGDPVYLGPG